MPHGIKVTDHDNRGTFEHSYGFVYFNDGRRVAYANGQVQSGSTGGWDPITEDHEACATVYLRDVFNLEKGAGLGTMPETFAALLIVRMLFDAFDARLSSKEGVRAETARALTVLGWSQERAHAAVDQLKEM